eukprot:210858-Chlamydomonas_euryale.AAC.2
MYAHTCLHVDLYTDASRAHANGAARTREPSSSSSCAPSACATAGSHKQRRVRNVLVRTPADWQTHSSPHAQMHRGPPGV